MRKSKKEQPEPVAVPIEEEPIKKKPYVFEKDEEDEVMEEMAREDEASKLKEILVLNTVQFNEHLWKTGEYDVLFNEHLWKTGEYDVFLDYEHPAEIFEIGDSWVSIKYFYKERWVPLILNNVNQLRLKKRPQIKFIPVFEDRLFDSGEKCDNSADSPAKKEAIKLYIKFMVALGGAIIDGVYSKTPKKAAIVAVEAIIQAFKDYGANDTIYPPNRYWYNVLNELEKLPTFKREEPS